MALIQHAWTGEPHETETVKLVDGIEVARNGFIGGSLQIDRPISDGHWWSIPSRSEDGDGIFYVTQAYGWETRTHVPLDPNKRHVTLSFYARLRTEGTGIGAGAVRISGTFRTADDEHVSGSSFPSGHEIPLDYQWHRIVAYAEAPPEAVTVTSYILAWGGDKEVYDFSRFMFTEADTQEEAIRQAETYFDGDTPDYYDNATPKVYLENGWATLAPRFYI